MAAAVSFAGLKGGALVSTLYAYSQHGDPYVSSLVKHLLNQVQPASLPFSLSLSLVYNTLTLVVMEYPLPQCRLYSKLQ